MPHLKNIDKTQEDDYFLGIDLGTSGCRIAVINEQEQIIASAEHPLPPAKVLNDGHCYQDPEIWWEACQSALYKVKQLIPLYQVRSIAVDGTSGTVLATDQHGQALSNALMYNDVTSVPEAQLIAKHAPAHSAAQGASSALAKCLHLGNQLSHQKDFCFVNQADWLAGQFSKQFNVSDENNVLKMGYDPIERQWPDWIMELDIDLNHLPCVQVPGEVISLIDKQVASRFGFDEDTRIVSGTTDSVAAFIATGAHQKGEAVTSIGSTLVLKLASETPIFNADYGIYSHRLGKIWLVGGASNSGGSVIQHYFSPQQIESMTRQLDPNQPTQLDYYPLAQIGERFPINDATLSPKLSPRPASDVIFFQAILEGIANIEKLGYKRLVELGATPPRKILTVGGGAINVPWNQIRANTMGVPVVKARCTSAAVGAAKLAKQGAAESID